MRLGRQRASICALCCLSLRAQAPRVEFEVASVRASDPEGPRWTASGVTSGGPETSDPSRITFSHVPLINILMTAFDVDQDRIVAPGWTANLVTPNGRGSTMANTAARFDIIATMPPGTTKAQSNEMLKNLLMDRFKMTYHLRKKEFDVYKATIATGGSRLKLAEAAPAEAAQDAPPQAPASSSGMQMVTGIPKGPDGFPDLPAGNPKLSESSRRVARRFVWPRE
jgi:uncharacterized protein (TIGR03435 family)